MIVYSLLLTLALAVASPLWLWRMAVSGRYRAGLAGRLGLLPHSLDEAIARRGAAAGLIWLHAVSVGEVLAAQRLIAELQAALPGYLLVVSTTTATGQRIAQEKLGGVPVFYYPLDFAFAVRHYLSALQPSLFLTVESEFWPRMLVECERAGVPVAVVNARISDRSLPRYLRLRRFWKPLLAKVRLFLAQGDETAERLRRIGVAPSQIRTIGNLKYDGGDVRANDLVSRLRPMLASRPVFVAGSTLPGEEQLLLNAWATVLRSHPRSLLILAPRHPQRFPEVAKLLSQSQYPSTSLSAIDVVLVDGQVLLLDTIGDLAALYQLATAAFVGGSLVDKGGHNPLEPARFGVPVLMGPSYENFREVVAQMLAIQGIQITGAQALGTAMSHLLRNGKGMGNSGQAFFELQKGAATKTVQALVALMEHEP